MEPSLSPLPTESNHKPVQPQMVYLGAPHFTQKLKEHRLSLRREKISTLQVNIGKRCNQACSHCHVEAGPNRTENMTLQTIERLLTLLKSADGIKTVDITGGAPELNPQFKYFVSEVAKMGKTVIDRCNLTVLFEKGQEETAEFLAEHGVQIVASLPCYLEDNVNQQRGNGVFDKSIKALLKLNELGYGQLESDLILNLVYNPVGEYLPPLQAKLEQDYKKHLASHFGVEFNQLFTITNMPIKRYAHSLIRDGKMEAYMQLLIDNFNPNSVENVMCKSLISIGWDGAIYDCDFNQMLEIPVGHQKLNVHQINDFESISSRIALADHCFGCTAGAGSSCTGALI